MKILIVDDHPLIIAGCAAMFSAEGDMEVFEARDADKGWELYKECSPDVCIIDISLPGKSGFELTNNIIKSDHNAKIIIFSMNDDPVFASRALSLGAKGYITKNDNPYLLIDAIRAVMSDQIFILPKLASQMSEENLDSRHAIWSALNERERDVLKLLGSGLHPREIAESLEVSHKTIANACSIIKNKLGLASTYELSQKAQAFKNMI